MYKRQALYDLAQTDNMGLTGAAQELLEQEQLWKVLTSSAVRVEEKKELIRSAAPLAGLEPLQAFLCLLAEEGHLDLFPDILEEVHQLELAADGGAVCVMTCAHKPDQAALDDVRRAVCLSLIHISPMILPFSQMGIRSEMAERRPGI